MYCSFIMSYRIPKRFQNSCVFSLDLFNVMSLGLDNPLSNRYQDICLVNATDHCDADTGGSVTMVYIHLVDIDHPKDTVGSKVQYHFNTMGHSTLRESTFYSYGMSDGVEK